MRGTAAGNAASRQASSIDRAPDGRGPWPRRLRGALAALLEEVAAPEASYSDALERLAPLLREGREYAQPSAALPPDYERMTVAGIKAAISDEVASGRTEQLPDLLPDLLFTVLTPYVGPEAASAEVRPTEDA